MHDSQDLVHKYISAEKFEFVQQDEKIYDQVIQGKPIGYLEDVWIRFRKKTN